MLHIDTGTYIVKMDSLSSNYTMYIYLLMFSNQLLTRVKKRQHTHLVSLSSTPDNPAHVDVKLTTRAF